MLFPSLISWCREAGVNTPEPSPGPAIETPNGCRGNHLGNGLCNNPRSGLRIGRDIRLDRPVYVLGNPAHSDAGNANAGNARMEAFDIGRHTIHCDCVGQAGGRAYQIAKGTAKVMPFNADGCAMVIDSPQGRLLHFSIPMMYLMAQLNDGFLTERKKERS